MRCDRERVVNKSHSKYVRSCQWLNQPSTYILSLNGSACVMCKGNLALGPKSVSSRIISHVVESHRTTKPYIGEFYMKYQTTKIVFEELGIYSYKRMYHSRLTHSRRFTSNGFSAVRVPIFGMEVCVSPFRLVLKANFVHV